MSVEVEQSPNARRKRAIGDLDSYIGGQFTSSGRESIAIQVCHKCYKL
jgi:hypothetical protein